MSSNSIAAFYSQVSEAGATIIVRHRYVANVNRFLFVVHVNSKAAAEQAAKAAHLLLGCQEPQHGFFKRHGKWAAYGVYRPLLDLPIEEQHTAAETVH